MPQGRHEPVRVTYTDGFDGLPVFTPDGNRLAWTSKRGADQTSQIFLADWNHAEARRLLGLDQAPQAEAAEVGESLALPATESRHPGRGRPPACRTPGLRGDGGPADRHRRASAAPPPMWRQCSNNWVCSRAGMAAAGIRPSPSPPGSNWASRTGWRSTACRQRSRSNWTKTGGPWRCLAAARSPPAEVVFAGYGIVAPGLDQIPDYDSYGTLDVKDNWVMVLRFQPESVKPEWRRHLVHYSDLAYKASVAKRLGALGLIVVTGPEAQAKDRLVELKSDAASSSKSIAGLALSDKLAAQLVAAAGQDLQKLQQGLNRGEAVEGFVIPNVRIAANVDISRVQAAGP